MATDRMDCIFGDRFQHGALDEVSDARSFIRPGCDDDKIQPPDGL